MERRVVQVRSWLVPGLQSGSVPPSSAWPVPGPNLAAGVPDASHVRDWVCCICSACCIRRRPLKLPAHRPSEGSLSHSQSPPPGRDRADLVLFFPIRLHRAAMATIRTTRKEGRGEGDTSRWRTVSWRQINHQLLHLAHPPPPPLYQKPSRVSPTSKLSLPEAI